MSVPPPSPWMCSCFGWCAGITSSGAFSTWPASGAGTWVRRFRMRGRRRLTASAQPSTPTPPNDRTLLLRATTQELGPTRDAVLETAVQRLDVSQKQAARGVHVGGAARDESPFGLGLRAGTDATQSAHALAGRTLRPRSRRQSPPHHGPLTLVVAVRAHPRAAPHHPHPNRAGGPGPPHCRHAITRARVAIRGGASHARDPSISSSTSTATSKTPLEPNSSSMPSAGGTELRPRALRLFAARTTKLTWSRALVKLVVEELYPDDLFTELVGNLDRVPRRHWPHVARDRRRAPP